MSKTKVTLTYRGHYRTTEGHDYEIVKISGSPTIEIAKGGGFVVTRVGSLLLVDQLPELAARVEVITLPCPGK